jgi:hypothetical protein
VDDGDGLAGRGHFEDLIYRHGPGHRGDGDSKQKNHAHHDLSYSARFGAVTADGCGTKTTKNTKITKNFVDFVLFVSFVIAAVARLSEAVNAHGTG